MSEACAKPRAGRHAAVRHRHHDIGLDRALVREFCPHRLAAGIDRAAVHEGIGPGEIDVFEDAGSGRHRREGLQALDSGLGNDHHLAVLDVAHEAGADDVERAGLGGEDVAPVELAEHERPDTERITGADELLVGQRDKGIGAFDLAQRLDEALDEPDLPRARHEMEDDLGIGGRLADGAVAHEFTPQRQAVGEVAVVRDREAAAVEFGEKRLNVAQDGAAGRRIADVADRGGAGEALHHGLARKMIADEPVPPLGMELPPIEGADAGRFLAAMLKGMEAERRDGGGVGMTEDAEDAAFLAEGLGFEIAHWSILARGHPRRRPEEVIARFPAGCGPRSRRFERSADEITAFC